MSTAWTSRYAQRTKGIQSSAIRELLKFTQRPEVISFAGGLPASEVFPAQRFHEACCKVLEHKAHLALQYGATEGYEPLREMVARHIARYGIKAKSENVLITSGSQQALDLIGKLLINPGDRVLVEAPTYLGALQAFNVYGADYVSVPSDNDGLRPADIVVFYRTNAQSRVLEEALVRRRVPADEGEPAAETVAHRPEILGNCLPATAASEC